MSAPQTEWTAEMARALPDDGNRYEVLDGELFVTPVPSLHHQRAVGQLLYVLNPWCSAHGIGEAMFSPSDIEFSEHRLLQPDVFVVPPLASGRLIQSWRDVKTLVLAVEVSSPTTARADRVDKRRVYQGEGVPEYWIIDLDARIVERWRPDDARPEILGEKLRWNALPDIAPLELDLPAYFASVLD